MLAHDSGFTWSEGEWGSFRTDFFLPVDFPVIPHCHTQIRIWLCNIEYLIHYY
jgi:hypothetical protein